MSPTELRSLQDWVVSRRLKMIPGVADVVSFGGFIKQYEVTVNTTQMKAYNVTLQQVFTALGRGNANAGGSFLEEGEQQYLIRGIGMLRQVLLPAVLLGLTVCIRVLGPLAGVLVALYGLHKQGRRALPALFPYVLLAIAAVYATWPYLWPDPVGHFVESIVVMAKYPWRGQVLFKHVLRNAMIPIITNTVIAIPFLYTGSLLLEGFFGIPGLGNMSVNAINSAGAIAGARFLSSAVALLLTYRATRRPFRDDRRRCPMVEKH